MNPESLEDLMLRDALGEASTEQQARLRAALAQDASLAERHAALVREVRQMEGVMGTAQSRQHSSADTSASIPSHLVTRLETERHEILSSQRGTVSSDSNVVSFSSSKRVSGPQARDPKSVMRTWLARAALVALLGLVTGYWLMQEKRPPIASAALAPRGPTGLTQPLMVWENKPDQKYDVWILPAEGGSQTEAPVLFKAEKVRSPLAFSELKPTAAAQGRKELQPGKHYRLLVCFATLGKLAGVTVPFETSREAEGALRLPPDTQAVLLKAKRLLESGKPGDALMVLSALAADQRIKPEVSDVERDARAKLPPADGVPRG